MVELVLEVFGLARCQLIVLAKAIQDVGSHKYALHAHIEVDAHLMVIVRSVILNGVRVQSHQCLQQIMRSVFLKFINLPLDFEDFVEELLWELELPYIDSKVNRSTTLLRPHLLSWPLGGRIDLRPRL